MVAGFGLGSPPDWPCLPPTHGGVLNGFPVEAALVVVAGLTRCITRWSTFPGWRSGTWPHSARVRGSSPRSHRLWGLVIAFGRTMATNWKGET